MRRRLLHTANQEFHGDSDESVVFSVDLARTLKARFFKLRSVKKRTSNLVIALQSGQEISMRLLSDGDGGNTPVDFVVNYRPPQSFLIGSSDSAGHSVETARDEKPRTIPVIEQALRTQSEIATPDWVGGLAKNEKNPDGRAIGKPLVAALGNVREKGDEMLVAYSVMNTTDHWIELLPPQVELNSPNSTAIKRRTRSARFSPNRSRSRTTG